ncbi:hypothetical protein ODU07_04675 [Streptococcus suis]|uniref:hypothetical protein n=1 Tax=Streptococcus sp. ZY1909104 TaxID=3233335 RepID=UPI0014325AD0|nr:hypothetical protein [Streptococcus suis]HEM3696919.1 hypothetical protein [Streptococcus suis]HEM3703651.1 hypothetical protein [Streptococcus suis]HEM3718461.1 hypothetical protein [Streptococcus suis]HEP1806338.1 hypothetical protein [Streptococcus suis]
MVLDNECVEKYVDAVLKEIDKKFFEPICKVIHNNNVEFIYSEEKIDSISAVTKVSSGKITVKLFPTAFNGNDDYFIDSYLNLQHVICHEIAHVLDILSEYKISNQFLYLTGGLYDNNMNYFPKGKGSYQGTTKLGHYNHFEDFADSFGAVVFGDCYDGGKGVEIDTNRKLLVLRIVQEWIKKLEN